MTIYSFKLESSFELRESLNVKMAFLDYEYVKTLHLYFGMCDEVLKK